MVVLGNNFDGLDAEKLSGHSKNLLIHETHVKGSSVYCENIVTIMLFTISTLVLSVAVISMKTFRVWRPILEWFPLMIGGIEQTVPFESNITG